MTSPSHGRRDWGSASPRGGRSVSDMPAVLGPIGRIWQAKPPGRHRAAPHGLWRNRPPGPIFPAMITRRPGRAHPHREAVAPQAPPGSRIYAIGDIHGPADLLRRPHRPIHEDAYRRQAPRNVVVYLGDYIDRGDESPAVIDLLPDEPLPSFESVYLKGNHEESLLCFLEDTAIGPAWLFYGGAQTLHSYAVRPPDAPMNPRKLPRPQGELAERLPHPHRRFMHGPPLT